MSLQKILDRLERQLLAEHRNHHRPKNHNSIIALQNRIDMVRHAMGLPAVPDIEYLTVIDLDALRAAGFEVIGDEPYDP